MSPFPIKYFIFQLLPNTTACMYVFILLMVCGFRFEFQVSKHSHQRQNKDEFVAQLLCSSLWSPFVEMTFDKFSKQTSSGYLSLTYIFSLLMSGMLLYRFIYLVKMRYYIIVIEFQISRIRA